MFVLVVLGFVGIGLFGAWDQDVFLPEEGGVYAGENWNSGVSRWNELVGTAESADK